MTNGEIKTNSLFEYDNAATPDEKLARLIELLTGVWQFYDTLTLQRFDTETHKGWQITYIDHS